MSHERAPVPSDPRLDLPQALAAAQALRVTQHAQEEMDAEAITLDEEMDAEAITLDEVLTAIAARRVIEDDPEHRRGACCLLYGTTPTGRPLHVVCTTDRPVLIIMTVYNHSPPWVTPTEVPPWVTPTERGSP